MRRTLLDAESVGTVDFFRNSSDVQISFGHRSNALENLRRSRRSGARKIRRSRKREVSSRQRRRNPVAVPTWTETLADRKMNSKPFFCHPMFLSNSPFGCAYVAYPRQQPAPPPG